MFLMSNIEKDIKNIEQYINLVLDKGYCDCNELNVISTGKYCDGSKNVAYSMQNILSERKQDKARIQELEAKLEFKQWGDLDNIDFEEYMKNFISKEKVKDKIERHKIVKECFEKEYDNKHYEDDGIRARDFYGIITQDRIIQVLEELLEDK